MTRFPPWAPGASQGYLGPALLLLLLAVAQWLAPADWLVYERDWIDSGELWRLVTGHLLHTNAWHWLLNAGALIVLWLLHGDHYRAGPYGALVLLLAAFIGLGLWLGYPELEAYYGLSGVLHGLFAWGACRDLRRDWTMGALLLLGVYVKVAWELWAGPSAATEALIEAEVAVSAHWLGALSGTLLGLGQWLRERLRTGA